MNNPARRSLAQCLIVTTLVVSWTSAQTPLSYYLPSGLSLDPAIPTPESYFGFQVGDWHLQPDQLHAYIRYLDERSDRFTIENMGETYERRPLMLAVITSPENHRNLSRIKEEHARLSDPSSKVDISRMPVVVWMGYSVHGNEASGSNAAAVVAYVLAAARGAEIDEWLANAVILLNPSINPDGLNRFAAWVNANRGAVLVGSQDSREHNEPWPGGRSNHYWFDLNRDWMPAQHPETRARLIKYYEWRPNLLTDHHEMGSTGTFFFQPGIPGRSNPLTPEGVGNLTSALAQYHARALNELGVLYYTRETFDDFYIGKGSSYPDITGGVGVLFEQASSRGHVMDVPGGPLTFPFAIRNHVASSISSIRGAVAMRSEFLRHQREFPSRALALADQSPVKAYAFGSPGDPSRVAHLVDILLRHQIEVYRLAKPVRDEGTLVLPDGGFVVPTRQPQFRLLITLFERRTRFEDSLFYDISAWNLPAAFNLPSVELSSAGKDILGERVSSGFRTAHRRPDTTTGYAYVVDWGQYYAPKTLYKLLANDIQVRAAMKPFTIETGGRTLTFAAGSLVIPAALQPAKRDVIRTILAEAAATDDCRFESMTTGLVNQGIDLGSPNLVVLPKPTVAVLAGPGASSVDAGEIWHLLDQRYKMPVLLLEPASLGRTDLSRVNTMILAGGAMNTIDSSGRLTVLRWIERGNTLIATEQASEWAITNKLASATLKRRQEDRVDSTVRRTYGSEGLHRDARSVPGAIVEAVFDSTHPLLFGYAGTRITLFKSTALVFETPRATSMQPVQFTSSPLVSGYLHPEISRSIARGGAVHANSVQSGRVILMTDNPAFRAFWFGTNRLMLNGIFFGSLIRSFPVRSGD